MRTSSVTRETKETKITAELNLDGSGKYEINTGIGFFDHMLTAFAVHSGIDLNLNIDGDLYVDCHHTIEDTGIVLGKAINEALGDKSGIMRYGTSFIPMDEALGFCSMDIGGRAFLVFNCDFTNEKIGEADTQMFEEFFRALAFNAGITLHLNCEYGKNDHHKAEAIFKAFAHAFGEAVKKREGMLSTKGTL